MLENYLKTSIRSLFKNKIYSIINILGLAIGLACFILVTTYSKKEIGYDTHFEKASVIYRINTSLNVNDIPNHYPLSHFPAADDMTEEFPEVKSALRLFLPSRQALVPKIKNGENIFPEEGFLIADSTFFNFFDFEFKYGDPKTALKSPFTVVLTEEKAKKYFGDADPVGKSLLYNDSISFKVTGVLKKIDFNTHLQFDFVANARPVIKQSIQPNIDLENAYIGLWYYAYIEVAPETDVKALEGKLKDFVKRHYPTRYTDNNGALSLQNIRDIHLRSVDLAPLGLSAGGNIEYLYILSTVAIAVLLVACFNFVNLATSRYLARTKEVGVRKAIGADRIQLVIQFISEATIITVFAGLVSAILVVTVIPSFNQLANSSLQVTDLFSVSTLFQAIVLFLVVGILSGMYPAFVLSRFPAALVLKGIVKTGTSKISVRKALVILQFSVSMILAIGTLVVLSQLQFLRDKNVGFDKENMIFIKDSGTPIFQKYSELKNILQSKSFVKSVSSLSNDLGQENIPFFPFKVEGKEGEQMLPILRAGFDFTETFDIEMKAGRFFDIRHPSDSTKAFVINESAAKSFGWTDAIGKKLTYGVGGSPDHEVIGVIKDFNYNPLRSPVGPLIINFSVAFGNIAVKLRPGDYHSYINEIEKTWKTVYPEVPFAFYFLDEAIDNAYKEEQKLARIYTFFCSLALFIASLGLFALASYTMEKRKKEIAVRKVMGASSGKIAYIMYIDFVVLVVLAFVVAAPVGYYFFDTWLNQFAYRIDMSLWIFLASFVSILVVSGLTVSYQTIKASRLNPATVLKNE